ncbi:hypothetical protein NM688_g4305 [Phlebia brevispora]|uniref:Uncharacterized protein n=1 Tax=Phlebia brevispora TaxID=194682 RepID=A0ACC1T305_9APHY|nr:hypothetical protein NM688_g4305 [Phlebia brevispora]
MKSATLVIALSLGFLFFDGYINGAGVVVPGEIGSSGCYRTVSPSDEKIPIIGPPFPGGAYKALHIVGAACFFLAELVVQICTWKMTWRMRCMLRRNGIKQPAINLLLRDGTMIYVAISVWSFVTFVVSNITLQATTIPFISTLLYRLMLRLRQVQTLEHSQVMSPNCAVLPRVVGNQGSPSDLGTTLHEDLDSDDEVIHITNDPVVVGFGPTTEEPRGV